MTTANAGFVPDREVAGTTIPGGAGVADAGEGLVFADDAAAIEAATRAFLAEAWNAGFRCACGLIEGRMIEMQAAWRHNGSIVGRSIVAEVERHLAAVRKRVPPANPQSEVPVATLGPGGDYTHHVMPKDLLG